MYISLRDREPSSSTRSGARPAGRVAPVVIVLGVVSLLTDVSSESVSAVLPLLLTSVLGLSPVAYGFIDGLYQGVSALVRIAAGWASDRGDHPKWIAIGGYGLSMLARVGLVFAGGFLTVAAVVTADRIGKGIRTAPRDAMITASSDPERLGRSFGVHRTLDTVGAALGPLIAFGILWLIPSGYDVVMVVSLAFAVLGVAVLVLAVPDVRPQLLRRPGAEAPRTTVAPPARFRWRTVMTPQLRLLLFVGGGLALVTVGDGFLYLALLDRSNFATFWFPMLYVGTNIAYLLLALPFGRLADRVGRWRVLVLGHVALLAAYVSAVLPLAGAAPTIATLLLLGAFYAATDGVLAAVASRTVSVEVRASGIAAAQTVVAVGRLVASAAFGVLWVVLGPAHALLTVAAVLALVIPVAYVALSRLREVPA
jgi:MFS family permease